MSTSYLRSSRPSRPRRRTLSQQTLVLIDATRVAKESPEPRRSGFGRLAYGSVRGGCLVSDGLVPPRRRCAGRLVTPSLDAEEKGDR